MTSFILLILSFLASASSYKILVIIPHPLYSHQQTALSLVEGLLKGNHKVTYLAPLPVPFRHTNLTIIDISNTKGIDDGEENIKETAVRDLPFEKLFEEWLKFAIGSVEGIFAVKEMQDVMKTGKFDAVIVENVNTTPLLAFAVHFNATSIGWISFETQPIIYRAMGNPTHPILHPGTLVAVPNRPNFVERLKLFYHFWNIDRIVFFNYWRPQEERMKKWFPHIKMSSHELLRNVDLNIETVSPVWNTRPLLPNNKQIGFMHIKPPNSLPEDLQRFLDSSKQGVIYVSFGGTVQGVTIGENALTVLREVLESLPYNVIWKLEKDISTAENIKIMKWTPQQDLLAHPNIKVFVTQGGFQSIEESVARGIPMVVIPIFADQEYNAGTIEQNGYGRFILRKYLSILNLRKAIMEVATNHSYKNNVEAAKQAIMDTPMKPVDAAVWWVEYAIRNRGAPHLRYRGVQMPWYQYLLLDILAAHLVAFGLVMSFFHTILRQFRKPKAKID